MYRHRLMTGSPWKKVGASMIRKPGFRKTLKAIKPALTAYSLRLNDFCVTEITLQKLMCGLPRSAGVACYIGTEEEAMDG